MQVVIGRPQSFPESATRFGFLLAIIAGVGGCAVKRLRRGMRAGGCGGAADISVTQRRRTRIRDIGAHHRFTKEDLLCR